MFASSNVQDLLNAALLAQDYCDAIDINLGCPQRCAKQGCYGAFLMDNLQIVYEMVRTLHKNLKVPVCCKIRIFPEDEKTLDYALNLEKNGCSLLVVHGRSRMQKGEGQCNWDIIKKIKQSLKIPVIFNGGIEKFSDVENCISATGCDGIMCATAVLKNPCFFSGVSPNLCGITLEYLYLCQKYPTEKKQISSHVFDILRDLLEQYPDWRKQFNGKFFFVAKVPLEILLQDAIKVIEEFNQYLLSNKTDSIYDIS